MIVGHSGAAMATAMPASIRIGIPSKAMPIDSHSAVSTTGQPADPSWLDDISWNTPTLSSKKVFEMPQYGIINAEK